MCVYIYIYIYVYVCIYVYIYIHIYIYICMYILFTEAYLGKISNLDVSRVLDPSLLIYIYIYIYIHRETGRKREAFPKTEKLQNSFLNFLLAFRFIMNTVC